MVEQINGLLPTSQWAIAQVTQDVDVGYIPPMQNDWRKRLTDAIDRKNTNMKRLSLAAGLGETFVRDALLRARIPSVDNAMKLCRELGVSYADIFGEAVPSVAELPQESLTTPDINIQQWPRDVPILGGAACGDDGLFEMNGQTLDHARRPPRLVGVKGIYALYVHGDCMSPWREPGGLVYVHPHQPVKIGDYVVVQMVPEGPDALPAAYIKRLVRRTADKLVLMQFNPREEKTLAAKKVKTVHRIMDWDEMLGI